MNATTNYAPGARVEIRDAEWVIRRVDLSSDKGYQLTCDGISELVRGKTSIFLSQLEDEIKILDPATTELVQDTSNASEQSLLYIESQLRQATANDEQIHIAHKVAMDTVPYQLDPAIQAPKQPRQRILIADVVGLGKTLEAGIIVTEQNERETWYDTKGRIIFTPSKGIVGTGLPRKVSSNADPIIIEYPDGKREEKTLGWEDVAPQLIEGEAGTIEQRQQLPDGTKIHRTALDDTLPGGPRKKTITYVAPFYLPNREEDYRVAWEVFTERIKNNDS